MVQKKSCYVAFFDISKAYDSVCHEILLEKLKKVIPDTSDEYYLIEHLLSSAKIKYMERD